MEIKCTCGELNRGQLPRDSEPSLGPTVPKPNAPLGFPLLHLSPKESWLIQLSQYRTLHEAFPKFSGQSQRTASPVHLLGRGGGGADTAEYFTCIISSLLNNPRGDAVIPILLRGKLRHGDVGVS